jgi:catalase
MFKAIDKGNYPVWNVYVQTMDPKQAEEYRWNIFDMTKVWPHKDFPLQQIGRLTMNRNVRSLDSTSSALNRNHPNIYNKPRNYFADIEQAAFSPSTMVPGLAPSADPG